MVGNWLINQVDFITNTRITNAAYLDRGLARIRGIKLPQPYNNRKLVFHLYIVFAERRDELVAYCKKQGSSRRCTTRTALSAGRLAPVGYKNGDFPVTDRQAETMISFTCAEHLPRISSPIPSSRSKSSTRRKMAQHNIPYVNLPCPGPRPTEDLKKIFEQVVLKGSFVGTHDDLAVLEKSLAEYCGTAEAVALNFAHRCAAAGDEDRGVGEGDEVITPPNSFVASTATIIQPSAPSRLSPTCWPTRTSISRRSPSKDHAPHQGDHAGPSHRPHHADGRDHGSRQSARPGRDRGRRAIDRPDVQGQGACGRDRPLRLLLRPSAQEPERAGRRRLRHHQRQGVAAERARWLRARHGMADSGRPSRNGAWSRAWTRCRRRSLSYRLRQAAFAEVIAKRRDNAALYQKLPHHKRMYVPTCRNEEFNTFHTFVVQVDTRDALAGLSQEIGIKTAAIHYPVPIHLQLAARAFGHKTGDFPMTERQAERILTLPVNQYMSRADVETVASGGPGLF